MLPPLMPVNDGVLGISAQFQCLFDDRCEVLILPDVGHFGIGDHGGGKYPVSIACAGRHQAVGGEQDWRGKVRKFFLLVLPCRAEVAFEMRIFFQFRIPVGRQHFTVGVDVDAFAVGLLQQQLQIVEVVTGNHDERPFFHGQGNGAGLGVP